MYGKGSRYSWKILAVAFVGSNQTVKLTEAHCWGSHEKESGDDAREMVHFRFTCAVQSQQECNGDDRLQRDQHIPQIAVWNTGDDASVHKVKSLQQVSQKSSSTAKKICLFRGARASASSAIYLSQDHLAPRQNVWLWIYVLTKRSTPLTRLGVLDRCVLDLKRSKQPKLWAANPQGSVLLSRFFCQTGTPALEDLRLSACHWHVQSSPPSSNTPTTRVH